MRNQKTIVINAATVKIAGGLIVTIDLIKLLSAYTDFNIILICPSIQKFQKLPASIQKIYSPEILLKPSMRWILDFLWLPGKIKKAEALTVLTMGNLPARTKKKQIMFNDNAFISEKKLSIISSSFAEWVKHKIRRFLFWKRLHCVNTLITQTNTEKQRLLEFGKQIPPVLVLPPLIPFHLLNNKQKEIVLPKKGSKTVRLVCLSYYWKHKNIEILRDLLLLAQEMKYDLQIIFTLNKHKVKGGSKFIQQIKPLIDKGTAINVGNISTAKIKSLIYQCDGVILPSIIETFGLNVLEAWFCTKPFFVADRPYSQEVGKDAVVFFDPYDPQDILKKITQTFKDSELLDKLKGNGKRNINSWIQPKDYLRELLKIIEA